MKKLFWIAAGCAVLAACQREAVPSVRPAEAWLPMNLCLGVQTRVTDTAFEEGDEAGIYVVQYADGQPGTLAATGNRYDNVKLGYSGAAWSPEQPLYWADKTTPVDFYCYHPYSAAVPEVAQYAFAVGTDQSTPAAYKASDFVWGKAAAVAPSPDVTLITTHHRLSNMVIRLAKGDGIEAEKWQNTAKTVTLKGVKTNAVIDLATGTATATASATDVQPLPVDADTFKAILPPQAVTSAAPLLTISFDGVEYTFKKDFSFLAGRRHTFTIKVSKAGSGINVGIGDWEDDGEDNGGDAD